MEVRINFGERHNLLPVGDFDFLLSEGEQKTIFSFLASHDSKLTAQEYSRAAREFLHFCARDIHTLKDLRRDHLILYQRNLKQRGNAEKTILKKIAAVSSLLKHLAHQGFVENDLSYGLKRPKSYNRRETADFTDEEVKKIFRALNPKRRSFTSHRALLAVGFYTGLRSGEILGLTIGNIGEVQGHRILNLIIKGGKPHEIPLNPFAWFCLSEHIAKLKELGFGTLDPAQWLFPCLSPIKNNPISPQAFISLLKARMKDAGIIPSTHRRYSPHSMRSTLAGHLLNTVQVPLEQVQKTLGHSSPTTTMRYNKRQPEHDKSPVYKIDY